MSYLSSPDVLRKLNQQILAKQAAQRQASESQQNQMQDNQGGEEEGGMQLPSRPEDLKRYIEQAKNGGIQEEEQPQQQGENPMEGGLRGSLKRLLKSGAQEGLNFLNMFPTQKELAPQKLWEMMEQTRENLPESMRQPKRTEQIPGYEEIKNSPEAWAAYLGSMAIPVGGAAKVASNIAKPLIKSGIIKPIKSAANVLSGRSISSAKQMVENRKSKNIKTFIERAADKEENIKLPEGYNGRHSPPAIKLAKTADDIAKDYYGTENYVNLVGKEPKIIGEAIHNNYQKIKSKLSGEYDSLLKPYNDRRLFPEGVKIKGLKVTNEVKSEVGKRGALNSSYKDFLENPNIKNAHDLQSKVGSQIADLKSVEYSKRDKTLIQEMEDLRKSLQDKIGNVVGNKYKDLTRQWKEEVIPYHEDPIINMAARKNIPSDSLAKRLNRSEIHEDHHAPITKVVSQMSEQQKRLVLSPLLKKAISTKGDVDTNKILDALNSARSRGFGDFITKKDNDYISTLQKLNKKIEVVSKKTAAGKEKRAEKVAASVKRRQKKFENFKEKKIDAETRKRLYSAWAAGGASSLAGASALNKLIGLL